MPPRARRAAAAAASADNEVIAREVRDALQQAREVLRMDRPRNHDLRNALRDLTDVIHKDPDTSSLYAERARIYVRMSEPKLALFDLTMAIQMEEPLGKDDHTLAGFYGARGQCFRHLGKLEDSLCDFKRARHYDKSDNGQWYYEMGVSFCDLGDKWRALEMFSLALGDSGAAGGGAGGGDKKSKALADSSGISRYGTSSPSGGGGQQNKENKGPKLKNREDRINCLVYRGNTYRELGALAESIEDLKRAVEMEPESASHHNILGLSYFEQQDYKSATSMFAKAVELDGNSSIYHNNLGLANFQQGQHSTSKYSEAYDNFRTAVSLEEQHAKENPHYDQKKGNITLANMYFNKGNAALSMDQIENALDDFDQAIARDPEDENTYHAKGIAFQNTKPEPRIQAAIQQFQKALSLNPTFKPSLFHMGLMYHSDNKPFKAMDCLAKDDMELLTDTGFVGYAEARQRYDAHTLTVAGYDQKTRQLVYEQPSFFVDKHGAPKDGMYEIETGDYSLKVTGNHQLLMECDSKSMTTTKKKCPFQGLGPVKPTVNQVLGNTLQPDGKKWPSGMKEREEETCAKPRGELEDDGLLYHTPAAVNGLQDCADLADLIPNLAELAPAWRRRATGKQQKEHVECALLELLGFWLNGGSFDSSDGVLFSPAESDAAVYLSERLSTVGLQLGKDYSKNTEEGSSSSSSLFRIFQQSWCNFLIENESDKCLWSWVWKLRQSHCRALLAGLSAANNNNNNKNSDCVFTTSAAFRDQIVRLALHAGSSAKYTRRQQCHGEQDGWAIDISLPTASSAAAPTFCRNDIKKVEGYDQGVWCVTMPRTGNIVVRRRHPDPDAQQQQQQSSSSYRPVIIGNCFAQVAKADPTDRRAFENIGLVYCDLLYFDLAVGAFTRAIEILPTNAVMYFYRGKALLWLGRYEAATADFDRAVELGCEEPQVFNNRALSYKYQKRYGDAIADLGQAISLSGSDVEFWYNRAMCYAETGQYPKAVGDLTEALKVDNTQHRLFFLRGKCAYLMGKYQEALVDLRHARAAQPNAPDAPEAFYYMGLSHARLDEYAHALQNFSEAVARKPNCAHYVHERAKALQHEGRYEEAVQDFTKVLALQPLNAHALFRRAFAYKSISKFAESSEDFENARKLQPLNHHLVVNFKKVYEIGFVELCAPGDEPDYESMCAVAEAARATAHVR